jgi:diguanylate cyclase (GGDEF)-like protein
LREAVPATGVTLYLQDETRRRLQIAETDGNDTAIAAEPFNADICFAQRAVHVAEDGVVAIPLLNGLRPFGVVELHFDLTVLSQIGDRSVFEAIGTRIAPLILNSLAFERSVSNALTDPTTDLPNERALFLVLEDQIAESQRHVNQRPLTLLAIDIEDFDKINQRWGHAAGDRVLDHVAQIVKNNLRRMDLIGRCRGDEFLAVLPTASMDMAADVIDRINTALVGHRLEISGGEAVEILLNFGAATFGCDGETADQLIAAARLRKDQGKAGVTNKVLWFPKELAN